MRSESPVDRRGAGAASLTALRSRRYRALLVVASALGLVGFLDEISFGARLFGWSMPEMTGGGELDGVHDLVILTYRLGIQSDPVALAAIGSSLLLVASLAILFQYAHLVGLAHRVRTDSAYGLFALSAGGLATAAVLDLGIGVLRHLGPLEEAVEMNAGLALLLAVRRARGAW
jgi:hypothetical protein